MVGDDVPQGPDRPDRLAREGTPLLRCPSCRRIRNGGGSWAWGPLSLEQPPDVPLMHAICPDCAREFYRGMDPDRA